MSEWEVIVERPAERYLAKLNRKQKQRIFNALLVLESGDFISLDVKRLKGLPGWRLRVGDYRVLFWVNSENKIIFVTGIGTRGDIYKK